MAIRFRNSGKKQQVKTGRLDIPAQITVSVDCGFVPVYIAVTVDAGLYGAEPPCI